MNNLHPLDRLRAWADGRLAPEDLLSGGPVPAGVAESADAGVGINGVVLNGLLLNEARAYLAVHHMTAPLLTPVPASRLRFEHLPWDTAEPEVVGLSRSAVADKPGRALRGPRRRSGGWGGRRWVAAGVAALLLVTLGVVLATAPEREDVAAPGGPSSQRPAGAVQATLVLTHIPLAAAPAPGPVTLRDGWLPVRSGAIAWLTDDAEASAVAAATGRRVLRYVYHPECPLCRALEADTLRQAGVLAAADALVPVKVDVTHLPPEEAQALFEGGWPHLAIRADGGALLERLETGLPATDLAREMARWAPARSNPAPTWQQAHAAARARERAARAYAGLVVARAAPVGEAAPARAALERLRVELGDTPEGRELARVLAAWSGDAPFPLLLEASR